MKRPYESIGFVYNARLLVLLLFFIPSCAKYENGPKISFLSKKSRITNEWKVEKEFLNSERSDPFSQEYEISLTDSTKQMRLILSKDNKADYIFFKRLLGSPQFKYLTESGRWEFYSNSFGAYSPDESLSKNEGLTLTFANGWIETFKIYRLSRKELWIYCFESGGIYGPIGHGYKLVPAK